MQIEAFEYQLHENGDEPVRLILPHGRVPGDYHLTEISREQRDTADCGRGVRAGSRHVVVQILAGGSGEPMSAAAMARIFTESRQLLGREGLTGELFFEYDAGVLGRYRVREVALQPDGLAVFLDPLHAACRPAELTARVGGGRCCSA